MIKDNLRKIKVLLEEHTSDGTNWFTAYPVPGQIEGGVVGEGGTLEEALADLSSALVFHLETLGLAALETEPTLAQVPSGNITLDLNIFN